MTLSEWIVKNTDSHAIQDHDALVADYKATFDKDAPPPDWPSHTPEETRAAINARGKGGELKRGKKRLCYGYQIAEYFAYELADWHPWQSGLGFRFRSAVDALREKGL